MPMELSRGWLEIDLDAIVRNARTMAAHAGDMLAALTMGGGGIATPHFANEDSAR